MSWRSAALLLLLACPACTAPAACEESADPYEKQGIALSSAASAGTALLRASGEVLELVFRGTLRGLPELWQGDSAVLTGNALLSLSLSYESEPFGSDGRTEMPRVEARFAPRDLGKTDIDRTPSYPTAEGSTFSSSLFETCDRDVGETCCTYGEPDCSVRLGVTLERLDGAPFPPLVVDWSVKAQATVSTCPLGGDSPVLSFQREGS